MKTKTLTRCALLSACALIIFIFEAQLPPLVPVPGIKPGLANIMTLLAFFTVGKRGAFSVLIVRIILGSVFTGNAMSALFSLAGGILAYFAMLLMLRFFKSPIPASIAGACAHNAGQIAAAVLITKTPQVVYYLPILLVSAVVTGLFTGFVCRGILKIMSSRESGRERDR